MLGRHALNLGLDRTGGGGGVGDHVQAVRIQDDVRAGVGDVVDVISRGSCGGSGNRRAAGAGAVVVDGGGSQGSIFSTIN